MEASPFGVPCFYQGVGFRGWDVTAELSFEIVQSNAVSRHRSECLQRGSLFGEWDSCEVRRTTYAGVVLVVNGTSPAAWGWVAYRSGFGEGYRPLRATGELNQLLPYTWGRLG